MASASLGQVHRATLRDGREVVVRCTPEHPRAHRRRLRRLEEAAGFLDAKTEIGHRYEFSSMVTELRKSLLRELDYREEAGNLRTFRQNLREFDRLILPSRSRTTRPRACSRWIPARQKDHRSDAARPHGDRRRGTGQELFRAYLQQILVDGLFHADPHPGNISSRTTRASPCSTSGWWAASPRTFRTTCCACSSPSARAEARTPPTSPSRWARRRTAFRGRVPPPRRRPRRPAHGREPQQDRRRPSRLGDHAHRRGQQLPPAVRVHDDRQGAPQSRSGRLYARAQLRSESGHPPLRGPDHAAAHPEVFEPAT